VKNAKPPHFFKALTQALAEADKKKEGSTDESQR
jgi:hypothetical protein